MQSHYIQPYGVHSRWIEQQEGQTVLRTQNNKEEDKYIGRGSSELMRLGRLFFKCEFINKLFKGLIN